MTLGDTGYKKLSRYYSELLPESDSSVQLGNPGWRVNRTINGHSPDAGMLEWYVQFYSSLILLFIVFTAS